LKKKKHRAHANGITIMDTDIHPTQKPLKLIRQVIQDHVPKGSVIIDPFAGSCSTLRAAKDLGYQAIGIEIDDRWLPAAIDRLGQGNLF